jgi:hypothetical protein
MIRPFEEQLFCHRQQTFVERSKTQARKQRRGLLLKGRRVDGGPYSLAWFYQEALGKKAIAIAKQQEAEKQRKNAEHSKIRPYACNRCF